MMSLKKFLAGVSLFSLLWTIPGFGAYQAVAQMAGGRGTNYSLGSAAVNVNAGNSVMPQAPFVGPAADMQAYDFFNRTAPVQAPQAVRARETAAAPMGVMPIRASIPSSVSRVSALGASVGAKISAVVSSVGALLRSNTPESRAVVASGEEMRARGNSFDGARSRREISDPMVQGAMSLSAADSSGGGSSRSGRSNKESARPLKPTPDQKGQDFSQIQPVRIQEEDGQLVMTGNFNRSLSATVRVMLNGVARAEHFQVSFQLFGLRGSQVRNMTPGELNGLRDALETYLQGFERPDQRPVNSKEIQLYKQMKGEAERILRNQGDFSKFAPTKIERDGRKSSTMYGKLGTSFVGTVFYSVSEKMFRVSLRRVGIIYAGLRARPMTRLELTDLEGALAKFIESLPEDSPNYNAYMDMAIAIGAKVGIKREPQDPTLDKLNFSELVPTGISRVDGTLSMWGVFVKLEDMMRPPSPDSRVSVQISHRIEGLSHSFDFYVQVLSSPGAMKEGPNVKMNLAQLSGLQRALQKHLTQRTYDPDTDTLRFYQRMLAEVSAALLKRSEDSRGDSASGGTRNERGNSVVSALLVLWGSLVVSTVAITAFGAAGLLSPATLLLAAASAGVGGLTVFRIAEKSGFAGIGKPLPNTLGTAAIGIILGLIGGAAVGAPFFTTAVTVLGVIYGATGVWSLTKGIRTSSIDREMGGFFSVILSGLAAAGLGFLGHFFGGSLATLLALPFHHASLVGAVPLLGMALLPGKFKFPKIGSGAGNERGQASMAAATAVVGLVLGFVVGLLCGSPGVGAILGAVIGGVIGSLSDRRSGGNGSGTRNERGSASGLLLGFGVGVAIIIASVALQSYLGKEISFVGVFVGFIVAGAFMLKAGPGGNSGSSQRGSIPVNAVTVLLSGLGLGALAVLGFVGLGAVSLATVPLAVASVGLLSLTGYQVARAFGLNPKNNKAGAMVAAAVGGLLGLILGSAAGAGMFTAVGIILGGAYGIRLGWALTRSQREQESIPSGASIALSVIVAAVTAVVLAGVVAFLGGLATAALSAPAAVSLWGVGAAVPLLGMALPWGSMSSFPAGASYRDPTYEEIARLKESKRLAWDKSPLVRELVTEFGQAGGDIKVDPDESARYHGRSIGAAGRNPLIVLALCVFSRWAFLRAIISREQTYFTKWYSDVPASAELLVAAYANMVVSFVEMTGSTQNRWADDLDHVHVGTRVLFVGSYYSQLREALKAIRRENAGFIFSGFYTRLRDLTARELNRDPNFQFSLYERLAGVYYRPNTPQHNQPINVPGFTRIDQATHDAASKKIYGASEGDDQGDIKKGREAAKQNTLGWLYYLFLDRGEI